jgi:hypothetical protein
MRMLILALMLGACTTGPWKDFYGDTRSAAIPGDVRDFVIDAQGCGHFSGEEPYDAERAAFLKKNMAKMCTGLDRRYKMLSAKYATNAAAAALISETWSVFDEA